MSVLVPTPELARTCRTCGGVWVDTPEGRAAHRTVFSHAPTATGGAHDDPDREVTP